MGKGVFSWSLYDFGNSAYASLVPVLLFPLYYKSVILQNSSNVDLWWGIAIGVSVLLAGLISPLAGGFADLTKKRKPLFIVFSLLAVIGILSLSLSGGMSPIYATILFVLTNMFFGVAISLYDSLLTNVSTPDKVGKVSGLGFGIGYAGAIICTLIVYPLFKAGVEGPYYWLGFVIVGIFYLLFALPAFFNVKEGEFFHEKIKRDNPILSTFKNVSSTLKNWKQNKRILIFLIGFYFLTEGIVTLTYFFSLYATTTLGVTAGQIAIIFIFAQIIAVPATIIVGSYSDKIGYKKVVLYTLFIWCLTPIVLIFSKTLAMLYVVAAFTGLVLGGSQSTARAWFTKIIPAERRSELFGFNSLASKISATIGPPLFGVISVWTGSQRLAMLTILFYFIMSFIFFFISREK